MSGNLRVWTDREIAGQLARNRGGSGLGASFGYAMGADPRRAVSLTMPVQVSSYEQDNGIHPIFDMNLPEGALRERLRKTFARATERFDDLDLLALTGRSQMGRIRYTTDQVDLDDSVPFQSVDEILARRSGNDGLIAYLIEHYAPFSGVSGMQPKILIRDEHDFGAGRTPTETEANRSIRGATHIVKFWDEKESPHLGMNEFFCMAAAQRAGIETPRVRLAEDEDALIIDRFDLDGAGDYLGMEDFCVLNGLSAYDKYVGGYERRLFRRLHDVMGVDRQSWLRAAEQLFTLFAFNCAIRNGDAHLKNFAVLYDEVTGQPRLAPAYDLITTPVYIPGNQMALTLDGKPNWPGPKQLQALGQQRCGLGLRRVAEISERIADSLSQARSMMMRHAGERPDCEAIAQRISLNWEEGMRESLGLTTTMTAGGTHASEEPCEDPFRPGPDEPGEPEPSDPGPSPC